MTARALRRLRVRIALVTAVGLGLALGALAAIAIDQLADRRRAGRDGELRLRAGLGHELAYQLGATDRIDVRDFRASRDVLGEPAIVVVDRRGAVVAGPPERIGAASRARLLERSRPNRRLVVDEGGDRVALAPVDGETGIIGTVAAVSARGPLEAGIREAAAEIAALALAGWLLGVGLAWMLAGRTIRPAVEAAQREQAFLADAAHELRTPLAVIRARAESGRGEEAFAAIARAAGRAGLVVEDMLAVAWLEARDQPLAAEPLRMDYLVEQVADELSERAEQAGVVLRLEAGGEPVVAADERLLARAVHNLVGNAIKHGALGGEVRVTTSVSGRSVRMVVADRGPGVAPAQRERIFERFYRGGQEGGGAGLGLAIARLVAEAHGGTLELLEPRPEEAGAAFALTLPHVAPA